MTFSRDLTTGAWPQTQLEGALFKGSVGAAARTSFVRHMPTARHANAGMIACISIPM